MIKCPRVTSKEWKYAESKLGLEYNELLYIFDFLGQREPSIKETNRIKKGETLTPYYNQAVWDVEVKEQLTKGRHAIVRIDKYGIEETVFEEVRTRILQPLETSELITKLNKQYEDEFVFEMKPTKDGQAWNILVKDKRVGLRSDSNSELQIDQSPKKPIPVIEIREGNEFVRDGIVYPTYEDAAQAPQDQRTTTQELFDRDLFDRIKTRLLKTLPYVTNIIEDTELPVSARLMPGGTEIRLNPLKVAKDSLGHEFGHVLIDLIGGMSNPLVKSGRDQLRDTQFEKEVIELYPELVGLEDDRLDKEVVTRALGKKVTELFEEEERRTKFENWMVRFFRRIRNLLGIEISSVQRLAEIMISGKPLATKETATAKELRTGLYIQRELGMNYYQDSKADQEDGRLVQNLIKQEEAQRLKALAAIETKISLYSKRAAGEQGERALETLKTLQVRLQDESDPTKALVYFIKNAIKTTKDINDKYAFALREERKGNPNAFTQRMLDEWRTYLSAYDILEQYKKMLEETNIQLSLFNTDADKKALSLILGKNRDLLKTIDTLNLDGKNNYIEALLPVLDRVIADKNVLRDLYDTKGKELTVNFLLPYVTIVETDYREEAWKKYSSLSDTEKAGRDREQFITDYISDNRDDIVSKTRELLTREIEVGNNDVGMIYRYVDTILDSPDVVASTLAKIWVTHMDAYRKEVLEARYQFVERLKALEKQEGRTVAKPDEELFGFMLERNPKADNILTQHLVSAVPSQLDRDWTEYKEMTFDPNFRVGSDNHVASNQERYEARENWLEKAAAQDKEAVYKAEHDFLLEYLKEGKITQKQMARWINNYKVKYYRSKLSDKDIFEDNDEVVLDLKIFRKKHYWSLRKLSPYYEELNSQWRALERMRTSGLVNDEQTDQRIVFYDFVVDAMEKADDLLPYKKRLGYRLPGMTRSFADRMRAGEKLGLAVKQGTKLGFKKQPSDIEKGAIEQTTGRSELVNEAGETVYLIPVNYINEISLTDQSFDVGMLYFSFLRMAMRYRATADILPAMEMGKYFVENREVTRRDAKGRPFTNALSKRRDRILTKSGKNSMIAAELDDFFKINVYGQYKAEEPDLNIFGFELDRAKFLDGINRYTSLSLLGLNVIAGTANVILGESLQAIDAWGKENFDVKNLAKATGRYYKDLGNILADVGERRPTSIVGLLNDRFDTLNEFNGANLNQSSKFRWLMQMSTVFFISHAGEHYMQSRAMMAMLDNIQAKDGDGKILGTILDMYSVDKKTKRLVLDERVANWNSEKETIFKNKLKRILSRLHGEYSQEGKSALQKTALGRMAILFRKFIVPGFKRRWQKRQYNNLSESYTEGNYITFGKFFTRLMSDMISLKFELLSKDSSLTPHEQANIKRTLGEIAFLLATIILSRFIMKHREDDPENEMLWSLLAYQAFRLRAELAFFIMPTEAMKILRSPMASMSFLESSIKLTGQLLDPLLSGTLSFDVYDRGPWKGEPKIYKTMTGMTPGFKQYFRIRDIADQLSWFQTASVQMR